MIKEERRDRYTYNATKGYWQQGPVWPDLIEEDLVMFGDQKSLSGTIGGERRDEYVLASSRHGQVNKLLTGFCWSFLKARQHRVSKSLSHPGFYIAQVNLSLTICHRKTNSYCFCVSSLRKTKYLEFFRLKKEVYVCNEVFCIFLNIYKELLVNLFPVSFSLSPPTHLLSLSLSPFSALSPLKASTGYTTGCWPCKCRSRKR